MRKKRITIYSFIAIFVGLVLCSGTYFMANGKIAVGVNRKGIFYPYDETIMTEDAVKYADIKNLSIDAGELEVTTRTIEGKEIEVKYAYLGEKEDLTLTKNGNTLEIKKQFDNRPFISLDFTAITGSDYPRPTLEIGIPKNISLETVKIDNTNSYGGMLDISNISITKELTIQSGVNWVQIKNATIEKMSIVDAAEINLSDVIINDTIETSGTYGNAITLENVEMKKGDFAARLNNMYLHNVKAKESVKIAETISFLDLLNFETPYLDLTSFGGELRVVDTTIHNNLEIASLEGFHSENSTFQKIDVLGSVNNYGAINLKHVKINDALNFASNINEMVLQNVEAKDITIADVQGLVDFDTVVAKNVFIQYSMDAITINNSTLASLDVTTPSVLSVENTTTENKATLTADQHVISNKSEWKDLTIKSLGDVNISKGKINGAKIEGNEVWVDSEYKNSMQIHADENAHVVLPSKDFKTSMKLQSNVGNITVLENYYENSQAFEKESDGENSLEITASNDIVVEQKMI